MERVGRISAPAIAVGIQEREAPGGAMEAGVRALEAAWAKATRRQSEEAFGEVERQLRGLAVRGRQAGYRRVPELASILEVMLGPVLAGEEPLGLELESVVADYLQALLRYARLGPENRPDARVNPERAVVMVGVHDHLIQTLAPQLQQFDYRVARVPARPGLVDAVVAREADAVVVDMDGYGSALLTPDLKSELDACLGRDLPLVVISSEDSMARRLAAARAGVSSYQLKPVDIHELIDRLDAGRHRLDDTGFHVVLVEDSPTQAAFFTGMLERAGIGVSVVHDPLTLLDHLAEVRCDLILMDMYMPGCKGSELARVVRQYPAYAGLPIVFLSAETQMGRQLDAMSLGGDDFLTKPIEAERLVRTVRIRARRARELNALMVTDQLTGLLNHTRIKEYLNKEVARAQRAAGPLAFVMLDIDHFKAVNDTHGHAVGDRVIKSLARVLQQRLRETDYIGRYGGEEFAVILPGASAVEAGHVMDAVRQNFSRIAHAGAGGKELFTVTFSAGVAELAAGDGAEEVALMADERLYRAKHEGRNRVITDGPD